MTPEYFKKLPRRKLCQFSCKGEDEYSIESPKTSQQLELLLQCREKRFWSFRMEDMLRVRPKRHQQRSCLLPQSAIGHLVDHLLVATMNAIEKTNREHCWFARHHVSQL